MNEMLSKWLGKLLFAIAVVWAVTAAIMNRPVPVEYENVDALDTLGNKTLVKLRVAQVESGAPEAFFVTLAGDLEGSDRKIFPTRGERIAEYSPVQLAIPDATVQRGPMVLPSPGPSLPGSGKLPRWGEEMPPLPAPPDPKARPVDPNKAPDPAKNPPPDPAKKPN